MKDTAPAPGAEWQPALPAIQITDCCNLLSDAHDHNTHYPQVQAAERPCMPGCLWHACYLISPTRCQIQVAGAMLPVLGIAVQLAESA